MPTFIVVHGSVSGKQVGESIELSQKQADHINSSGKMLRREDEAEAPRERVKTAVRIGLDNKPKTVQLQGTVIKGEDEVAELEEPAEEEAEEEKPAPKPAKAPKPPKPAAKKGG